MGCGCSKGQSPPPTGVYENNYGFLSAAQIERMPKVWCDKVAENGTCQGNRMCPKIIYDGCVKEDD